MSRVIVAVVQCCECDLLERFDSEARARCRRLEHVSETGHAMRVLVLTQWDYEKRVVRLRG
jgi:hypothetical protein